MCRLLMLGNERIITTTKKVFRGGRKWFFEAVCPIRLPFTVMVNPRFTEVDHCPPQLIKQKIKKK